MCVPVIMCNVYCDDAQWLTECHPVLFGLNDVLFFFFLYGLNDVHFLCWRTFVVCPCEIYMLTDWYVIPQVISGYSIMHSVLFGIEWQCDERCHMTERMRLLCYEHVANCRQESWDASIHNVYVDVVNGRSFYLELLSPVEM